MQLHGHFGGYLLLPNYLFLTRSSYNFMNKVHGIDLKFEMVLVAK